MNQYLWSRSDLRSYTFAPSRTYLLLHLLLSHLQRIYCFYTYHLQRKFFANNTNTNAHQHVIIDWDNKPDEIGTALHVAAEAALP